jgi:hypothetical protein
MTGEFRDLAEIIVAETSRLIAAIEIAAIEIARTPRRPFNPADQLGDLFSAKEPSDSQV